MTHRLLAAAIVSILLAGSAAAASAEPPGPRALVVQVGQQQVYDLSEVSGLFGFAGFPANYPDWAVSSPTEDVKVARLNATDLRVKILKPGPASFSIFPQGSGQEIVIPVISYKLDRKGLYQPDIVNGDPLHYDASLPVTMIATLRMIPYVPGLHYELSFFGHRTTFADGSRAFSVTTGAAQTSHGQPGFRVERAADGTEVGVLSFAMIIPADEDSWCLKTEQTQVWPGLFPTPTTPN